MELDYEYLAQLVRETQKGDSDAFAELYTATYQKQYRFAYQYVKDPYLAQDILQDVYILQNIRTLKNPRLFVSWLHQITFRICFDTFKRKQIQEAELSQDNGSNLSPMESTSDNGANDPEKHVLKQDTQIQIMNAIQALPPHLAQPLIMRYYNNMSIDDISDAMDLSRSTIKRRIQQARKMLESSLSSEKGGIHFE